MPAESLSTVEGLQQRCETLRRVLSDSPGLCTPAELADYWPGGAENLNTELTGWIYCYANLLRFWGRDEGEQRRAKDDADRLVLEQTLAGKPEAVDLDRVDDTGHRASVNVYPKSMYALQHAMDRDVVLRHLAEQYHLLDRLNTPTAGELQGRCLVEMGYQQRLLVWLVCSEAPGLPWPDENNRPDPPDWTGELSPLDVVKVVQAHRRVNGTNLQVAAAILGLERADDGTTKEPMSWATLMASLPKYLGKTTRALMRDEPLVPLVTQVMVAQHEEASRARAAKRSTSPVPSMVG